MFHRCDIDMYSRSVLDACEAPSYDIHRQLAYAAANYRGMPGVLVFSKLTRWRSDNEEWRYAQFDLHIHFRCSGCLREPRATYWPLHQHRPVDHRNACSAFHTKRLVRSWTGVKVNADAVSVVAAAATVRVGSCVQVSDASPHGWPGRVIDSRPGWLTICHDGHYELVDTTRRRVQVHPERDSC
jgi:hypothetical protein